MRIVTATRYAAPLREGGSLPAIIEGSSDSEEIELFVAKFKGAGQGAKALVAEIIVGEIARHLQLPIPEIALIELSEGFGRTERDPEIQDILKASVGLNVGLRYLDGAFNFNPLSCDEFVSPELAADIVWLDALTTNIDRTIRNPNLMVHERRLQLIDHGAALFFHHDWNSVDEVKAQSPFAMIKHHVLLPMAGSIEAADSRASDRLGSADIQRILNTIPDELLMHAPEGTSPAFNSPDENREAYVSYFSTRLSGDREFVREAARARSAIATDNPEALPYRR